jgi:hypothetical protein
MLILNTLNAATPRVIILEYEILYLQSSLYLCIRTIPSLGVQKTIYQARYKQFGRNACPLRDLTDRKTCWINRPCCYVFHRTSHSLYWWYQFDFITHTKMDPTKMYSVVNEANTGMARFSEWFQINKWSINVKKFYFIVFPSKNRKYCPKKVRISIDGNEMEQVTSTRFLWVVIDEKLMCWYYQKD